MENVLSLTYTVQDLMTAFVNNVEVDSISINTTDVSCYHQDVPQSTTTENVPNVNQVMNSIQTTTVLFQFQTQMTIVPNTNSSIKAVHGTVLKPEDAEKFAKFVTQDINLMEMESVFHVLLFQTHSVLDTTPTEPVMFVHTDQSDNQTDHAS